jgi:large subunit ribosomal protein L1
MAVSKRVKKIAGLVDRSKAYELKSALDLLKKTATAKFDESVDVAVNLGIDAKKSDQVVRGSVVLPRGTGKTVRVAVFAQGANAEKAKNAGADIVGFDDLAEKIKGGFMDFDVVIATPDAMKVVGPLGQVLGPRGLMPNPKVGTVTADVTRAVREAKAGKVEFRVEKAGIVHVPVGKASFEAKRLLDNVNAILDTVMRAKPATAKGTYLKGVSISTTMGPGIRLDAAAITALHK